MHTSERIENQRIPRWLLSLALIGCVVVHSDLSFAWGNEGHTYINRVAAQKIPGAMPRFLRSAAIEIAYLGPEPDRWRNSAEFALKNAQEPDHFIDLERIAWLDPLPAGRYEFYRKLYEKRASTSDHPDEYLPERVGLQPYVTMEIYDRLKAGFREYRRQLAEHQPTQAVQQAIIFYAGWLGHYVADGSQPLHTTVHYNGWVGPNPNGYTTQHGIHSQFETSYVDANLKASDFSAMVKSPARLSDPFADYMAYLKESHSQVEKVYSIEKAGGFTGKGTSVAHEFTAERLAAGSQMLLNLWYNAWVDSAQPAPEHAAAATSTK